MSPKSGTVMWVSGASTSTARHFEGVEQVEEVADDEAINLRGVEAASAVNEDGRDAGGAGAEDVEDVGIADVECVVGDGVGAAQGGLEELGVGLGTPNGGGDDGEVEVVDEAVVAQDKAEADAPI